MLLVSQYHFFKNDIAYGIRWSSISFVSQTNLIQDVDPFFDLDRYHNKIELKFSKILENNLEITTQNSSDAVGFYIGLGGLSQRILALRLFATMVLQAGV